MTDMASEIIYLVRIGFSPKWTFNPTWYCSRKYLTWYLSHDTRSGHHVGKRCFFFYQVFNYRNIMNLDMQNTSTYIDQDYKVSVMKFSQKDAIKDNAEKLLDIGLMTMKVCTSDLFHMLCTSNTLSYQYQVASVCLVIILCNFC